MGETPSEQVQASIPESTDEGGESEPTVESAAECAAEVETTDVESTDKSEDGPVNPHLEEIMKCPSNEWQLEKKSAVPFKSLEDTPFTIVDSKDTFDEMMTKLREVKEIGLATKRCTYRSFYGFCSLVKIATRTEVFIVDAIALKDEVKVLSEIFTNPGVLKVVHTHHERFVANLQKDLGVYLVNMFSICAAWKTIPRKTKKDIIGDSPSMTALLKKHCDLDFESFIREIKSAKSESWSERPLTDGKIKCSRIEVQYLLHIYDVYRNILIDMDLLRDVYTVCNKMCKSVWYEGKVALHSDLYMSLYKRLGEGTIGQKKAKTPLTKLQLEVFKVLHDWRYTTAFKHDESRSYVLKDMAIYRIANTLPKDVEGIKKSISPDEICPLLEEYFDHLCELIANTIAAMASNPESSKEVQFSLKRKGSHTSGQTHAKKKDNKKTVFNGRRGSNSGHPRYPMNHAGYMMDPRMGHRMGPTKNIRMGPWMGPQMGPWMGPQMGPHMGPRGMRPYYGMGMYQPGPFYGW